MELPYITTQLSSSTTKGKQRAKPNRNFLHHPRAGLNLKFSEKFQFNVILINFSLFKKLLFLHGATEFTIPDHNET